MSDAGASCLTDAMPALSSGRDEIVTVAATTSTDVHGVTAPQQSIPFGVPQGDPCGAGEWPCWCPAMRMFSSPCN